MLLAVNPRRSLQRSRQGSRIAGRTRLGHCLVHQLPGPAAISGAPRCEPFFDSVCL
jgi:hypothetical protein